MDPPPADDVLGLLVNFCKDLDDHGLLPGPEEEEVSATASSSRPNSSSVEGCKPKASPPLLLPTPKPAPPAAMAACLATPLATSSDGFAKGLPLPVEENYQQKKLVVNPYEMKKFLYGQQQTVVQEDHIWENIFTFIHYIHDIFNDYVYCKVQQFYFI